MAVGSRAGVRAQGRVIDVGAGADDFEGPVRPTDPAVEVDELGLDHVLADPGGLDLIELAQGDPDGALLKREVGDLERAGLLLSHVLGNLGLDARDRVLKLGEHELHRLRKAVDPGQLARLDQLVAGEIVETLIQVDLRSSW